LWKEITLDLFVWKDAIFKAFSFPLQSCIGRNLYNPKVFRVCQLVLARILNRIWVKLKLSNCAFILAT
jgi:hypothetical protein